MSDLSLSELTLENIGLWPPVVKLVTVLMVFSLTVGLAYFLSFKEQLEHLDRLHTSEVELLQTMISKQKLAANLKLYQVQLAKMQKKLGKLLQQLPGKSEIPELLEDISQTGLQAGLKFQLFDPRSEVSHDFYVEIPIKIKVDGSYEQIAKFISKVASMKRIVTIHDFKLRFPSSKAKSIRMINGKLPLFLDLTAKVYRYQTLD